ncbi:MAG: hypothetical protein LCI00_23790 [Chloroflexi bacterium]|nr:hypothetical protein [Chloroflexota bacterium]MCC6896079.1 hypothetical protein [Anaerolineae bacterium]
MPDEIVLLVFSSRKVLTKALDRMATLDYIDIRRGAIVAKAANGETIVLDDDVSPNQGGIAGGTLGAAMGALGVAQLGALALPGVGPIIALGTAALVGGLVGRATGRFAALRVDFGFRVEQIEPLASQLQADHPALVLDLKNADHILPRLHDDLRPYKFEVIKVPQLAIAG